MRSQRQRKNRKIKVTPEVLEKLQDALNDKIKPDYKEKRDGKKPHKKYKKGKPSNGSTERNQSQGTV